MVHFLLVFCVADSSEQRKCRWNCVSMDVNAIWYNCLKLNLWIFHGAEKKGNWSDGGASKWADDRKKTITMVLNLNDEDILLVSACCQVCISQFSSMCVCMLEDFWAQTPFFMRLYRYCPTKKHYHHLFILEASEYGVWRYVFCSPLCHHLVFIFIR